MNRCEEFQTFFDLPNCSTPNDNQTDEFLSSIAEIHPTDRLLNLISMVYMSMVLVVGLIGNSVATFIFIFSPLWRRNPTTKYLMALAIADNLVIISMGVPLLQAAGVWLPYFPYLCHLNVYAFYVGIALTGYYCRNSIINTIIPKPIS